MSRDITPFGIRMPSDLKAQVDAAALAGKRSINSEVIDRIQKSFEGAGDAKTLTTGALIEELVARLGARIQIVVAPEVAVQAGIDLGPSDR